MKQNQIQKERLFIIALVVSEDEDTVEAIKIYNPVKEETALISLETAKRLIEAGKEIVGLEIKTIRRFCENTNSFILKDVLKINEHCYKINQLTKINGNEEVLLPGKKVIVGCEKINDEIKFITVDSEANKEYKTKKEILKFQDNYIGIFRGHICRPSQTRIDLLKNEKAR